MGDKVLEARTNIESSFVCLFWLSDDSRTVTETSGDREFTDSDILNRVSLDPKGMHDAYKLNPYAFNRGRVSLVGGKVEIMVGKNCKDEFLPEIKRSLGLSKFNVNVYKTGMYDKSGSK